MHSGHVAPADYGDPRREYLAAKDEAAVFELSSSSQVELTGRDRAKFLHNFCTNEIRGLTPGQGCEAFLTNVQGKVLAYVNVYVTPDSLWLTGAPGIAPKIIAHLSRYQITEDVTFADRSGELGMLLVAGPQALSVVAAVIPAAAGLAASPSIMVVEQPVAVQVRRHDFLLLPTVAVVAGRQDIAELRTKVIEAGARAAGQSAFDALRIEAGFPLYGVDVTDDNLAQEVSRTAQAISFTKGCYLGQEPIARIDALGHVNQQLRGLRLTGNEVPPVGSEIFASWGDGKKIGRVTSAALSYADGRAVVLAYVRRGFETPGATLEVCWEGKTVPAEVFWPSA